MGHDSTCSAYLYTGSTQNKEAPLPHPSQPTFFYGVALVSTENSSLAPHLGDAEALTTHNFGDMFKLLDATATTRCDRPQATLQVDCYHTDCDLPSTAQFHNMHGHPRNNLGSIGTDSVATGASAHNTCNRQKPKGEFSRMSTACQGSKFFAG